MAKGRRAKNGVCLGCGREKEGVAAKDDWVILAARKTRAALRMGPRHTVACAQCIAGCSAKREKFEKSLLAYRAAAGVFLLLALAGSFAYGKLELLGLAAALLGAAMIACLPYLSYCPSFAGRQ
jgi:hypothetical protein